MERRASDDNPLVPAVGCFPMAMAAAPPERVLHLALRDAREKQPGLARALKSISSEYVDVDWTRWEAFGGDKLRDVILTAARVLRPTLVFMQLQRKSPVTTHVIADLRALCDPSVVIVNWDGDQHYEANAPERAWFRELGSLVDTSLVVNTKHPEVYRRLGVRNPGYLQIGIDGEIYREHYKHEVRVPPVVMLANRYEGYPAYQSRRDVADTIEREWGSNLFGVYGAGWTGPSARPFLSQVDEAPVYTASSHAISMSIRNDLPRYTSDRLFRALACGAYVCVERFPDMEGLGLVDGVNCRFWTGIEELCSHALLVDGNRVDHAVHQRYCSIRKAAAELAHTHHTWDARMPELLWIVDQVRAARG
jgi:hypothetical protein